MCIISKILLLIAVFLGLSTVSGEHVSSTPLVFPITPRFGALEKWSQTYDISNSLSTANETTPKLPNVASSQLRRSRNVANRGGLGLILAAYFIKGCLYLYAYFKLICICMGVSLLFLLLCPLLPFLIPALILILLVAVGLSIAIPLIVAASGGDEDLLLVSN